MFIVCGRALPSRLHHEPFITLTAMDYIAQAAEAILKEALNLRSLGITSPSQPTSQSVPPAMFVFVFYYEKILYEPLKSQCLLASSLSEALKA